MIVISLEFLTGNEDDVGAVSELGESGVKPKIKWNHKNMRIQNYFEIICDKRYKMIRGIN